MIKPLKDQYNLATTEFLRRLRDTQLRKGPTQIQAAALVGRVTPVDWI